MKARMFVVVLAFAMLVPLPGQSWANLIANGDFGTGDFTGWTQIPAASGSIFGVGSAGIPIAEAYPYSGTNFAYFGAVGGLPDTITQTITDTTGQLYTLSFYLTASLEPGTAPASDNMFASVDGTGINITNIGTEPLPPYTYYSFDFVGTGSDVISFASYNLPGYDLLDDVSVNAVPEPSTMFLLGSGLLGLAAYGRKKFFKK